jgi:hypothetical protein
MSEYELVKKLGSCDNFKGLKSMAKVPRHKLFARNKFSAPTVCTSTILYNSVKLLKQNSIFCNSYYTTTLIIHLQWWTLQPFL